MKCNQNTHDLEHTLKTYSRQDCILSYDCNYQVPCLVSGRLSCCNLATVHYANAINIDQAIMQYFYLNLTENGLFCKSGYMGAYYLFPTNLCQCLHRVCCCNTYFVAQVTIRLKAPHGEAVRCQGNYFMAIKIGKRW